MSNGQNSSAQDKVVSAASKLVFDFVMPSRNADLDYNLPNVIYIRAWSRRSFRYVWETVQKINEGFNWHKSYLKNSKNMAFVG